jgi:hypothetical protein
LGNDFGRLSLGSQQRGKSLAALASLTSALWPHVLLGKAGQDRGQPLPEHTFPAAAQDELVNEAAQTLEARVLKS